MGFIGVYRAIYDYDPQGDDEIAVKDGDIVCILEEDQGDGWWKAKKKAASEEEDEPEGLVPGNYIEKVSHHRPLSSSSAFSDWCSSGLPFTRVNRNIHLLNSMVDVGYPLTHSESPL